MMVISHGFRILVSILLLINHTTYASDNAPSSSPFEKSLSYSSEPASNLPLRPNPRNQSSTQQPPNKNQPKNKNVHPKSHIVKLKIARATYPPPPKSYHCPNIQNPIPN